MGQRAKLLSVGGLAALVMGLAVGGAAGNRLEVSAQQFRIVWSPLTADIQAEGISEVRCLVTLEGSFHARTFVKSVGALVGYVTSSAIGQRNVCQGGAATVLAETLPWHVRYTSFEGTLPRIRGAKLSILGVSWRIFIAGLGLTCLYRTEASHPAALTLKLGEPFEWNSTITSARADESIQVRSSDFLCERAPVAFAGEGRVTQAGTANTISLRLI